MALHVTDLTPVETPPVLTRYRRIVTPIPAPGSVAEIERLRAVEPHSMAGMPPILWDSAEGFLVRDAYGNQWIDLSSGIVVANIGHSHPELLAAVRAQVDARLLFSYAFPTRIRRELLERLVSCAPPGMDKAILFSSGTEANECAFSLMRKRGVGISPGKLVILSIESSYHGRTLSAKHAGGPPGPIDGMHRETLFHRQLSGANSFEEDVQGIAPESVAGIILESIPGWSTTLYPDAYIRCMMDWAAANNMLVAMDEVQCGIGRTGRFFAFEHYGIVPDLITCGKGLSSSLPVAAVIGRKDILDMASPGDMSSTFGGNPVCAAAALACLNVMEKEKLVERSAQLGVELADSLAQLAARHGPHVKMRNGRGLFHSLHLHDAAAADDIVMECIRRGVLLFLTGRGFLKIVPPLVIERDALFEAISVIGEVMDQRLG